MKATRGLNLKAKIRRDAAILVLIKARRWIRHMRIRFKAYRLGFFLDFFFGPNFCIARGGRPPAKISRHHKPVRCGFHVARARGVNSI